MGFSLCLAALNVFFEDTEHLSGILIHAMYFMCPIIYPIGMLSPQVLDILELNPMFTMIEIFKDIFYFGALPDPFSIIYAFSSSLLILLIGLIIFNKADKKMIYFI